MTRLLLAVAALVTLGCETTREVWSTATRNTRYRTGLAETIASVENTVGKVKERRRAIESSAVVAFEARERGLAEADEEIATLRAHLGELRRELAELNGDLPPRRQRCPVHGNWMVHDVIATEPSDTPSVMATPAARRMELWKFPHRGAPAFYSDTQMASYTRPWVCRQCQEAHTYWLPRLQRHGSGSWPKDADHLLIEVVSAVEGRRSDCRVALGYQPIDPPFHVAATFTAHPDGSMGPASFVGAEHALDTELTRCLTAVIQHARMRQRPAEPVAVVRLPVWTEL